MVRAIMHGCNGKMGQVITGLIKADEGIELVAGIDTYTGIDNDYPVFERIDQCDVKADVIIDFSNAKAVDDLLDYCTDRNVPVVLCTTGLSKEQLGKVKKASERSLDRQASILSWWRGITIRRWTRPAGQPLRWRIPSMKPWIILTSMYMTEARCAGSVTRRRLASLRFGEEPLWEIMR